jgi:hypothetical protein
MYGTRDGPATREPGTEAMIRAAIFAAALGVLAVQPAR